MLKTLDPSIKSHWKDHIAPLVHAYNCTRHQSTGYTPYFLLFGRTPRFPVDVILGLTNDYPSMVAAVKERLQAAYKAASDAARQSSKRQAEGYDRKVRGSSLQPGDFVLIKHVAFKGKHKIADKW